MISRVQAHGRQKSSGREILSLVVPQIEQLPRDLGLNSHHCVLFLAVDAAILADEQLFSLVEWVMGQRAVYVCVWGQDCERVHDLIDEAVIKLDPPETVIMTTWHDGESLEEALWFALNSAMPASAYSESCSVVIAVSIGSEQWEARISAYLSNPDRRS